jgi:Leucine-rich repeat (LRR) protein
MPTITIRPNSGNPETVTAINCGTSTSDAKLGGSIDLSPFTNLQSFICKFNGLELLNGYSNKGALVTIDCEGNSIFSSIEDLSGLTSLEAFNFQTNNFFGEFPNLQGLTNLKYFRVFNNNLSGKISDLSGLSNLEILNYGNNPNIIGPIPPSLNTLQKLSVFQCYSTGTSDSIPPINNLTNLTRFYTYRTPNIIGDIPVLTGLTKLRFFACYESGHTGNIPELTGLAALEEFECYKNNLEGTIQLNGTFPALPALKIFRCYQNKLVGSIPVLSGTVPGSGTPLLPQLSEFRCDVNDLTSLGTQTFTNLPELQYFSCADNIELEGSIPTLENVPKLHTFAFNDTSIDSLINTQASPFKVTSTLSNINARNSALDVPSIDALLKAVYDANRTDGTKFLNISGVRQGTTQLLYPSHAGVTKEIVSGASFSRANTTVTVQLPDHGYNSGTLVTITDHSSSGFPDVLIGTFFITVTSPDTFTYNTLTFGNIPSGSITGNAELRTTSNTVASPAPDGYAYYQELSKVSRPGGPWNIIINQPIP